MKKVGGFAALRNLILPRVRTYHTKKPSRFVHALPARPLKVQGGRESSTRADESKDFCQPSPVGEGGARSVAEKYAEKRQNILIPFIKCTIHDKIEDNRASVAKMMGGERQRQRRGTRLACARWRKEKKAGFPVIFEKPSFSIYIGNVTTLLQADYRYITKAAKALTSGGYMNKMEAYEYKHE